MKKLKTRDEILATLDRKNIKAAAHSTSIIADTVNELISKGIIEVAEDEVPDWESVMPDMYETFFVETRWCSLSDAIRKFTFYSWYFNKQANGGVHWVPDWNDCNTPNKHSVGFNHKYKEVIPMRHYDHSYSPNFFYFKTPEAREKTLKQMTKEELKLLGLSD